MSKDVKIHNRGARFLFVTAALVLVVAGLREIKPIALPLVLAIFLSVLSAPLLSWLIAHRIPRLVSVLTTVLANVLVVVAMLLLVGNSVSAFARSAPSYQLRLEQKTRSALLWLEELGINTSELDWLQETLPNPPEGSLATSVETSTPDTPGSILTPDPAAPAVGDGSQGLGEGAKNGRKKPTSQVDIGSLFDFVTGTLRTIASLMTTAVLVFLMMIFILFEASALPRKLQVALGWEPEDLARMTRAKTEMQHYLAIKTLISLVTGGAVYLWVLWMGIDFPLLWGLIAFFLNYIPSLGSILASIPAMALALVQVGTGHALLVGIGYLVINLVFGNTVEPHLMGRQLGISTLVVFLSLIFWGWVWGPVGMLLAVPLTMILKIFLEHTEDFRWLAHLISANPLPASKH